MTQCKNVDSSRFGNPRILTIDVTAMLLQQLSDKNKVLHKTCNIDNILYGILWLFVKVQRLK